MEELGREARDCEFKREPDAGEGGVPAQRSPSLRRSGSATAGMRCPGCYLSPLQASLGDPRDQGDLGKIGRVAEGDFMYASISSLFEGCLWLRPSKSGSHARLPPNPC